MVLAIGEREKPGPRRITFEKRHIASHKKNVPLSYNYA
jgi:hypothetical protein